MQHDAFLCQCGFTHDAEFCECQCQRCKDNNNAIGHLRGMHETQKALKELEIDIDYLANLIWDRLAPNMEKLLAKCADQVITKRLHRVSVRTDSKLVVRGGMEEE